MKKSYIRRCAAAALLATAAVSSCKKDDGGGSPTIVGEWEARSEHSKLTNKLTTPPTINQSDTTYEPGKGNYINFRPDNTYIARERYSATSISDSGIYSYSSGRIIVNSKRGSTTADTANITLNANDFTLSLKDSIGAGSQVEEYSITYNRR